MNSCSRSRMARRRYIAAIMAAFAVAVAGIGTAVADIKPGAINKNRLRSCAPGYSVVSVKQGTYKCNREYTETCRNKYSPVEHNPSYGVQRNAPSAIAYICEKTEPGNGGAPTAQDCTAGFARAAEIPNSKYECRQAFNPVCRIGHQFVLLEYFARSLGLGSKMSIVYTCRY